MDSNHDFSKGEKQSPHWTYQFVDLTRIEAFFAGHEFDVDLHNYLIAVRNKHVAHSVNEFKRCEATAVMVGTADRSRWRPAGIGFTEHSVIGLSRFIVEQAIAQVSNILAVLTANIDQRRLALYEAFRAKFEQDGKWEMAPMFRFPDRGNAPNRRT